MAYPLALSSSTMTALARTRTARAATPLSVRGSVPLLCRGWQALRTRVLGQAYRPELHYMRGGRTPGCRSLAPLGQQPAG